MYVVHFEKVADDTQVLIHAKRIENLLRDRRDMLSEYFSMSISESGMLESIPLLLKEYVPNLDRLPEFLMRLGPQVCQPSVLVFFYFC